MHFENPRPAARADSEALIREQLSGTGTTMGKVVPTFSTMLELSPQKKQSQTKLSTLKPETSRTRCLEALSQKGSPDG